MLRVATDGFMQIASSGVQTLEYGCFQLMQSHDADVDYSNEMILFVDRIITISRNMIYLPRLGALHHQALCSSVKEQHYIILKIFKTVSLHQE